jgi:internalin A
MEEDDDLVPEPNAKGVLELTNRAWVHVDIKVFEYSSKIALLDISYNQIHSLPIQIGELSLMREFKASFNKLTSIPVEIGKLKRLRKLFLNGNQLKVVPVEIGKLEMLEELVLSENKLDGLPVSISLMGGMSV